MTHLDETGVDQDARAERVEDATDDACGRAVRVVRRAHAETDRDACVLCQRNSGIVLRREGDVPMGVVIP